MAAPAHPDLSQIFSAPSTSTSSPKPPIPKTSFELLKVIRSCKTHKQIQDTLIPLLDRIAAGEGQTGAAKRQKMKNGEKLLRLEGVAKEFNLVKLKDAEIKAMTAALVYILSARFDTPSDSAWEQLMMGWMEKFAKELDPEQIRLTGSRLGNLAWSFHRLCKKSGKPESCIPTILSIQQSSYPPNVFNGVFPAVLESCILAKEYGFAFQLIDEVPKDFITAAPSYLDVLTYFHHSGLIFAATGNYERAKESFVLALCIPTAAASAIQLASAKRAILCDLITSGKLVRYPKYIPGTVSRIIDRNAETYTKLAKAFEAHDWATVQAAETTEEFKEDCNFGLVSIVIGSIMKRKILRVKETFSRLRLDQLIEKVGEQSSQSDNILVALQLMIANGEINATIAPADPSPVINFVEDVAPPPYITARQLAEAEHQDTWLEASLIRGSREMGLSEKYLNKQLDMSEMSGTSKKPRGIEEREIKTRGGVRGVGSNLNDLGF